MSYSFDKKTGEITLGGGEKGIAPSPHVNNSGVADLKGVNISSINGEISVAYARSRVDQAKVTGGSMTNSGSSTTFGYVGTLTSGTWILVNSHTGSPGVSDNNYYFVKPVVQGTSFNLYSDFGVTQITSGGGASTINFTTLAMGAPMDYCIENYGGFSGNTYRYFIIDTNYVIWVSGSVSIPGVGAPLSTTMTWSAITPHGTVQSDYGSSSTPSTGSIQIMYGTDPTLKQKILNDYLIIFTDSQIFYAKNSDNSGWPSKTGSSPSAWYGTANGYYSGGYMHKSILGTTDQIIYFTNGPTIGVIGQVAGTTFNPAGSISVDYIFVVSQYIMAATDSSTRIAFAPVGAGLSVVVGGTQNNIYFFPIYYSSTANQSATTLLWTQESNVQYLLQANNFVIIFSGNKGNIYLTNGSSVVKIEVIPDYIPGSINFVQDPYYIWGGAMYLRGRIFFSIKDQTSTHTGNCGGVWSFVPSFSYYANQDVGLSLRMEDASSQYATHGFNGYAPVMFSGQEAAAQQVNGPQYIAAWAQTTSSTTTNSIDFSGTNPLINGSSIIEYDAVPVGTFLEPRTFSQIEVKLAANLVSGESIVVNYRTDLSQAWASAGTISSETLATGNGSALSRIIQGLNFQSAQIIQVQLILTSTVTNPSWVRVKDTYIR